VPVLESADRVNWTIIAQVFSRLDFPEYDHFKRYGRDSWAPALQRVHAGPRWEDPCPFWDDDGKAYLGHSLTGAGPIELRRSCFATLLLVRNLRSARLFIK